MPMLPFFPWATISEPLRFGDFHLVPLGHAVGSGVVPADMVDAVSAVVAAYGFTRVVDAQRIPVLHEEGVEALADLSDAQVSAYFAFRDRLAFACLASRRFFDVRYVNSDNVRLVIQGFTAERAGGAMVVSRRRDGAVNTIIPKDQMRVRRPHHVSGWCELPRDLDTKLLIALEAARVPGAVSAGSDLLERVDDAVRLFVGGNSDSPDVSPHTELVDLVSAFGRLTDAWKEDTTVREFLKLLPAPPVAYPSRVSRPRASDQRVIASTAKEPIRAVWLRNAFRLRHNYGHGRVTAPEYSPIWSEREHLLLGAVALPLALKALLRREGLYAFTAQDETLDRALDDLALVEPFAPVVDDDGRMDHWASPWREVLAGAALQPHVLALAEAFERAFAAAADAVQDRSETCGSATPDATASSAHEAGADAPNSDAPSSDAARRGAAATGDTRASGDDSVSSK